MPKTVSLFYSYSHDDEDLRKKLNKHLAFLKRGNLISEWHDRDIELGGDWAKEIDEKLASADIILLLISASFIASDYCWGVELKKALERHAREEATVVPVILRPCQWQETIFAKLQACPTNGRAVTAWIDADAALDDVAGKIGRLVKAIRSKHEAAAIPPAPKVEESEPTPLPCEHTSGEDQFGRWMQIAVPPKDGGQSVVQRLRWIKPGTFRMGSPENEPERFDSEGPRHQVTISTGFWLADTACTQALWRAVMGNNPSRFTGDLQRPVECVSWGDVQNFLSAANELMPGVNLVLPSEAQWEYACLAGSSTPFFFGTQIIPEWVNYDGNHPYGEGEKGLYRQETVPVKSLPANDWGLYQMHGNVWEWCADHWHDSYQNAPTDGRAWVDHDAKTGAGRVLRGGSWDGSARLVRSASRYAFHPGYRNDFIGFRLARVQGP